MKRFSILVTALLLMAACALPAMAEDDIAKHKTCKYCGMDREKWNYSRVFIEYQDGSTEGNCSIHCAAVELATNLDKTPTTIWVGDYDTKTLIDAEKASWVIGGTKPGVMTKRAKWAFGTKEAAEAFIKENQGQLAGFDQVIKSAYEDMYEDTKMIRERRAAKRKAAQEQKMPEGPKP